MKKIFLGLIICFLINKPAFSGNNLFFSPGISIAYTFRAGLNWGFLFDTGLIGKIQNQNIKCGLSLSWYYIGVQSTPHRRYNHHLRSLCVMIQNDFADLKLGIGRAKKHGGTGSNCTVSGRVFDISFSYPDVYSPWIGYKTFRYDIASWAWFDKPYKTLYMKYKYDVVQNTGLKNL